MEQKKYIQSLERASEILHYIADNGTARLSGIAQNSGLKNTTAYGLLQTLEHLGYVVRTNNGLDYSLGLNCLKLGLAYGNETDMRRKVRHILSELVRLVGETAYFEIKVGKKYYYYDVVMSSNPLRVVPDDNRFIVLPENSAVTKMFRNYQEGFRYATDLEEITPGLNCFAVPYLSGGTLAGCIALTGPSDRFRADKMDNVYEIYKNIIEKTETEKKKT